MGRSWVLKTAQSVIKTTNETAIQRMLLWMVIKGPKL